MTPNRGTRSVYTGIAIVQARCPGTDADGMLLLLRHNLASMLLTANTIRAEVAVEIPEDRVCPQGRVRLCCSEQQVLRTG